MKLLLLAAIPALAQVTITIDSVNSITDRAARVNITTSATARAYAQFGSSYGSRSASIGVPATTGVVDISGLNPSTKQDIRICQDGFTPPTGCSSATSITTLAPLDPTPAAPAVPDTTYPVSFTAPTLTVDADCSNLAAHIATKKALDGNQNHLIVIPTTTYCPGMLSLPVKTGANPNGTGKIVIASSGTLPPVGTRLTTGFSSQLATIYSTVIPDTSGTSDPATCMAVDFFWRTDTLAYKVCLTANTWTAVTATPGYSAGAGAPSGACVLGRYYTDNTGPDARDKTYYCPPSLKWVKLTRRGDGGWAVGADASANGYWLSGIRFDNAVQNLSTTPTYVSTDPAAANIVVDRSYFKQSTGYTGTGFSMNGANIALINSIIDVTATVSQYSAINNGSGTGPFYIYNNYLNSCFNTIFFTDGGTTVPRDSITIKGNTITQQAACNPRSASPDGLGGRDARGPIELKRGTKVAITGNIFEDYYNMDSLSGGSAILMTPRAQGSTGGDDNAYQISDIDIRDNIFRRGGGGMEIWGNDDQGYRGVRMTKNVRIANNLGYDLDGNTYYAQSPTRSAFLRLQDGIVGLEISRNTWYNGRGTGPAIINFNAGPFGGLNVQSNILWINQGLGLSGGDDGGGIRFSDISATTLCDQTTAIAVDAKVKLDKCALSGTSAYYSFLNNAIVGGQAGYTATFSGTYPATTLWPGDTTTGITALKFTDTTNSNYRLKYTSTTYGGLGVDQDAIVAAGGMPYNARVVPSTITSSGATISYTAPDTAACTVRITGIPDVVDAGGSRFRNTAVTGLGSGAAYSFTVHCSQSVSGSFTTL